MPGSPETNAHCAAPSPDENALPAVHRNGRPAAVRPIGSCRAGVGAPRHALSRADGGRFPALFCRSRSIPQPRNALVVMHGHPRDAARTLQAAIDAAQDAGDSSLLVAPLFQVPVKLAAHCHFRRSAPAARRRRPVALRLPGSRAAWIMAGRPVRSTPWITCWPI